MLFISHSRSERCVLPNGGWQCKWLQSSLKRKKKKSKKQKEEEREEKKKEKKKRRGLKLDFTVARVLSSL